MLPLVSPYCASGASLALSGTYLVRRAHTLGITDMEYEACQTVADLQRLAKTRFRALAKHYHPDQEWRDRRVTAGARFRVLHRTYAYLMALPATALLPTLTIEDALWLEYRRTQEPLGYGMALPERPRRMLEWGWGYV